MNDRGQAIVVNATALDQGGALSILRQFVENIPRDNFNWLIFISPSISISSCNPNVRIEPIDGVKPMHKRLWWDAFGLKRWLKKNDIKPIGAISLQNTGFKVGKSVPSYIYYHQSLPFHDLNWSPLKSGERTFWFYKNIYPFFVKLFLKKDSKVFVQLDYIKTGFAKRFKHPIDLIEVYSPTVFMQPPKDYVKPQTSNQLKLIYPAAPHFYKNHRVIGEALKLTDADAEVFFTINNSIKNFKDKRIKLIGPQSFDEVCDLYNDCDALLFPSYIETFGLPLLEAAMTGMPIIAADLPYAHEVLRGYEGVKFVAYDAPEAWAIAIENLRKGERFTPIDISKRPGWEELFESMLKDIYYKYS